MDKFLIGKKAVVTGGTRGIGRAIAEKLAAAGAAVTISGQTRGSVDKARSAMSAVAGIKIHGHPADVSKYEDVVSLMRFAAESMGGIDILVNNAGVGIFRSAGEMSLEEWRHQIDVNLTGAFYCFREAFQYLKRSGAGYVINISSLAGRNPFAGGSAYNASKFGLNGFSEAMMLDHRHDGLRVTYVMPGSVDTEFNAGATGADWKIAPADVADMVLAVLHIPERTMVSRVEIRPSRPKK